MPYIGNKPADTTLVEDNSISTAKIVDSAVTTAKINNDAVTVDKVNLISTSSVPSLEAKGDGSSQDGYIQLNCSQNSHGVKLKSPPHSANQSYTLTLPSTAPATDKMLQTNSSGVLSFVDAPSGSIEYIQGGTSSSNTTIVAQEGFVDTSKYAYYKIWFYSRGTTEAQTISSRFRNGGSELTVNNYRSHVSSHYNNGEHDSSLTNTYATIETDMSTRTAIWEFDMFPYGGINTNSSYLVGRSFNYKYNSDNQYQRLTIGGYLYNENVAVDGVQFERSGGFANHEIRIYGVKP